MAMRRTAAWALDGAALDRLLTFLDSDRERAARRYEELRQRLLKLFEWRGCLDPEALADRSFDRVARRLLEGVAVATPDPYAYLHGVALNVARESWRDPAAAAERLDGQSSPARSDVDISAADEDREQRLSCLDRCLAALGAAQRDLLLAYHAGDRHVERRQALAAGLGIPLNALRIRVHRLRATVEACVVGCMAGNENRSARTISTGEL
jgi:DNA-directed RNA polymerase specialized sigma24 family protein